MTQSITLSSADSVSILLTALRFYADPRNNVPGATARQAIEDYERAAIQPAREADAKTVDYPAGIFNWEWRHAKSDTCVNIDYEIARFWFMRGVACTPAATSVTSAESGGHSADAWRSQCEALTSENAQLRDRLRLRDQHKAADVWYWQGDDGDNLQSMGNGMAVVIRADQLRALSAPSKQPTVAAPNAVAYDVLVHIVATTTDAHTAEFAYQNMDQFFQATVAAGQSIADDAEFQIMYQEAFFAEHEWRMGEEINSSLSERAYKKLVAYIDARSPVSDAAISVLAERKRQQEVEGYTPEQDDKYVHCDILWSQREIIEINKKVWPDS